MARPSQQTRDAALFMPGIPDGTLPDKLTIATMQAFLDAYDQSRRRRLSCE